MNIYRHFTANEERLSPMPFRRELSLQAYLMENPEILGLDNEIFASSDVEIIEEELSLKGGRKSKETDGRIDLLIMYSGEFIGVVELKRGQLEQKHLIQLEDYLREKDQILEKHCKELLGDELIDKPKFVGVLVGTSINMDLAKTISDGYITEEKIPIAALTIQRFRSEIGGVYVTTDIFFKDKQTTKDRTKYKFAGKSLTKGRLVLEVLKRYVEDHPEISKAELKKIFPDKIQGTGVFTTEEDANEIIAKSKTGIKRHFIKSNELIHLSDATIAVSNQWGDGKNPNMPNFLEAVKKIYPDIQKET